MKKLLTVVFTMLLAGSLTFAQKPAGPATDTQKAADTDTGKKATKAHKGGKKGHKGGKKGKKGSADTGTTPPK
ncbi:MAG TPA: hypothetical protein VI488_10290 [Candidatus Angelobacter sp.]